MTGKTTIVGAVLCALIATACNGGGGAEPGITASSAAADPATADPAGAPTEQGAADGTGELDAQGPTDSKSDLAEPTDPGGSAGSEPDATAPEAGEPDATASGDAGAGDAGSGDSPAPADVALEDRSAVALPLDPPEGGFDEGTVLLQEDFQSTTPRILETQTDAGSGGFGRFDERRFYEIVLQDPDGRVAGPLTGLDAVASEQVFIQQVSFVSSFEGLARMDRGVYCWASNGNDPLAGSRYELLFTQDARVQVIRYGEDGSPEALVIDEPYDFTAEAADPDPGGLEPLTTYSEAARIGLLCRPDSEGRAQIAARVERAYYVTTDDGGPTAGGGAGIVAYGGGTGASTGSITTFDSIFVLDGSQVPLR